MHVQFIDTEAIYHRLLHTSSALEREKIFQQELVEPFAGLMRIFGGDGLATFRQWGISPEQFAEERQTTMTHVLHTLQAYNAWDQTRQALEEGWAAFAKYANRIKLPPIVFALVLADMKNSPLSGGYSGFGGIPGWIIVAYDQPTDYTLARIKAVTVHELHHNILGVVRPFNIMTAPLAEYMIMEGLAESFAAELYGADKVGFWISHFDESQFEETRQRFKASLLVTGFDTLRSFIFGDAMADYSGLPKTGIPAFAGYALGFQIVQDYLKKTGKSVAEATFDTPQQIIAESAFFD